MGSTRNSFGEWNAIVPDTNGLDKRADSPNRDNDNLIPSRSRNLQAKP